MMVPRTLLSVLAVLAAFVVKKAVAGCENYEGITGTTDGDVQVCCAKDCGDTCDQNICSDYGNDESCCPDSIAESDTECGVDGGTAPCILACENFGGITGTTDGDVQVCCAKDCGDTCDQNNCSDYGNDESCCPDSIAGSDTECGVDDGTSPCILDDSNEDVGDTPAPTSATESIEAEPSQDDDDDDLSSTQDEDSNSTEDTPMGAIVGGVVAGTLVIVAVVLAVLFKTGRLKASRGSSSKTSADDVKPTTRSGPVPADDARPQASEGSISQYPRPPQYPVAHQYPQAL